MQIQGNKTSPKIFKNKKKILEQKDITDSNNLVDTLKSKLKNVEMIVRNGN